MVSRLVRIEVIPQFLTPTSPGFTYILLLTKVTCGAGEYDLATAIGHSGLCNWAKRHYRRNPSRWMILRYRSASLFLR